MIEGVVVQLDKDLSVRQEFSHSAKLIQAGQHR